jgi:triacylglycerol lipase
MPKTIITRNPQKPLFIRTADEFLLKSDIYGPISKLSLLERGLWFAELSMFSYLTEDQLAVLVGKANYELRGSFASEHGHAYLVTSPVDAVVVIRGSGERDWEELRSEQRNLSIFGETIGKVHRCFKSDVDELWPKLESELEHVQQPVWFCGHSLGGAYANICAQRCLLSYIRSEPKELHTFGSPRIGNKKYVQHVHVDHYRWVNNNDFIARVPAVWFGYRHSGQELYLDREGKLNRIRGWRRIIDRLRGATHQLFKGRVDYAEDHSVTQYVDRIFNLVRAQHPLGPAAGSARKRAQDRHPQNGDPLTRLAEQNEQNDEVAVS